MAQLPDSIDLAAPRGAAIPDVSVRPSDLGLGAAGQALTDYTKAKKVKDDEADDHEAQAALTRMQSAYAPAQAQRQATWDYTRPGYATDELSRLDAAFAQDLASETRPGVRQAMIRRFDAYKAQVGDHAISVESAERAEPARQARIARETVELGGGQVAFTQAYADSYSARLKAFDGSQPGFSAGVMADFDAAAATAREGLSPERQSQFDSWIVGRKADVYARAYEVENQAAQAYVARNVQAQAGTLANAVLTNPAGYDGAVETVEQLVSSLPAATQEPVRKGLQAQLANARISGLAQAEDYDTALAELADGRYDAILDPDDKLALTNRVKAAKASGPDTVEEWARAFAFQQRMDADVYARGATGQSSLSLGDFNAALSSGIITPRQAAEYQAQATAADRSFAAVGDVRAKTSAELTALLTAPELDPNSPTYTRDLAANQVTRQAADAELKARQADPAAWAMAATRQNPDGGRVAQAFEEAMTAGPGQVLAAGSYAAMQLNLQSQAGIAPNAQRILPKAQASALAATYTAAAPEGRADALKGIAAFVAAMPAGLPGGAQPRAQVLRELQAAGMVPASISAIVDFADDPSRMATFAAAVNNPHAKTALPGGGDARLKEQISRQLAPYMATADTLPGMPVLNAGREARALLMARHLMDSQGLSANEAAKQATADISEGYVFRDGYRIPAATPAARSPGVVRQNAAQAMGSLLANAGAALYPDVSNPALSPDAGRRLTADNVRNHGRWVTTADDSGLVLMIGQPGRWTPVQDRYGRDISLTWSQLADGNATPSYFEGVATGPAPTWPWQTPPAAPPPAAVRSATPAALTRATNAVVSAVITQESGGRANAVSPAGAQGRMQLMPDTARAAAGRLGVAFEPAKLLTDAAYNERLGREELRFLTEKYDGNVALALAGYNAGPGKVDEWIRRFGDPRTSKIGLDEWVALIPFAETRDYVRKVLPRAYSALTGAR